MGSIHFGPELYLTRAPTDATCAEQPYRGALRWHASLTSPQCTSQDRENFERWCADASNAAAYVALCGGLAFVPELAWGVDDDGPKPVGQDSHAPLHDAKAR